MRFLKGFFIVVFGSLVLWSNAQDKAENVITKATRLMSPLDSYSVNESLKSETVGEPLEIVSEKMVGKNGLIHLTQKAKWGQNEAYLSNGRIAVKNADKKWELGTEKNKGQWDQLLQSPSPDLAVFGKEAGKFQSTGRSELVGAKACTVYDVKFDEEAAKALSRMNWKNAQFSGVGKVWVSKDDLIQKYELVIDYHRTIGETAVDGKITRVEELSRTNVTSVSLPEEVASLLAQDK